jgi:hypothetical protein
LAAIHEAASLCPARSSTQAIGDEKSCGKTMGSQIQPRATLVSYRQFLAWNSTIIKIMFPPRSKRKERL